MNQLINEYVLTLNEEDPDAKIDVNEDPDMNALTE